MAHFNTDNLPGSLSPTKAQTPQPNRGGFWNRSRLVRSGILAVLVVVGAGIYATVNRNAATADGDPTLPLTLDYTTAQALRGWGASPGFPTLADNVSISSTGVVRLASKDAELKPEASTVASGEEVAFTFTNRSTLPVQFGKGTLLYEVVGTFTPSDYHRSVLTLQPGESKRYTWNQQGDNGQPVKPGTYTLSVEYMVDGQSYNATAPVTLTSAGADVAAGADCAAPATATPTASNPVAVKVATLCGASPAAAKVGDTITLRGSGFNASPNLLMIDGLVAGTLTRSADGTTLTAKLPATLTKPCKEVCFLGKPTPLTPGIHQLGLGVSNGHVESGPITKTIPLTILDLTAVSAVSDRPTPPEAPKLPAVDTGTYTSPVIALDPARKLEQLQIVKPSGSEASFKVEMSTDRTNYQSWFTLKLPASAGANLCTDGTNPTTGERFGSCTSDVTVSLKDMKEFEAATSVRVRFTLKTIDTGNPSFNGFRIRMSPSAKPYVPVLKPLTVQSARIGDTITLTEVNGRFSRTENYVLIDDAIAASRLPSSGTELQLKLPSSLTCATKTARACTKELTPGPHKLSVRTSDPINSLSDGLTSDSVDIMIASIAVPSAPIPPSAPSTAAPPAVPTVATVAPTSAKIGDTVTVSGTGFNGSSVVVLFDGLYAGEPAQATKTDTSLTFTLPAVLGGTCLIASNGVKACGDPAPGMAKAVTPGTHKLSVQTANGVSDATDMTITETASSSAQAPTTVTAIPSLTIIEPAKGEVGATFTVKGSGLAGPVDLLWNGEYGDTTSKLTSADGTTLTATVPASIGPCVVISCRAPNAIVQPGSYSVTAKTAGGTSGKLTFTVEKAVIPPRPTPGGDTNKPPATPVTATPTITLVKPATARGNATVTVSGSGFETTSSVQLRQKGKTFSKLTPTVKSAKVLSFTTPTVAEPVCMFRFRGRCIVYVPWKSKTGVLQAGTYQVVVVNGALESNSATLFLAK